jgi:hypothetical protein
MGKALCSLLQEITIPKRLTQVPESQLLRGLLCNSGSHGSGFRGERHGYSDRSITRKLTFRHYYLRCNQSRHN